jgi:hypothetical protein
MSYIYGYILLGLVFYIFVQTWDIVEYRTSSKFTWDREELEKNIANNLGFSLIWPISLIVILCYGIHSLAKRIVLYLADKE